MNKSMNLSSDSQFYNLTDTTPYSEYYICIAAVFNGLSRGPWTCSSKIQTPPAGEEEFNAGKIQLASFRKFQSSKQRLFKMYLGIYLLKRIVIETNFALGKKNST